jgi:hypothetical protein
MIMARNRTAQQGPERAHTRDSVSRAMYQQCDINIPKLRRLALGAGRREQMRAQPRAAVVPLVEEERYIAINFRARENAAEARGAEVRSELLAV